MQKTTRILIALATTVSTALHAGGARAEVPTKVWVSSAGTDSLTCGALTTPCRNLSLAFDFVAAGGEIGVLTPGDYDAMGITKSVFVTNDGVGEVGIRATNGGINILIEAGAGDTIGIRGLSLDGQIFGGAGISFTTGVALHVQNCVIRNFELGNVGYGIAMGPSGHSQMFVSDTIIYNNGSAANSGGIFILPTGSGSANVVLDRVHLEDNVRGIWADSTMSTGNGAYVVVRDSVVSGNVGEGILALSAPGKAPALFVVEHSSVVSNAGTGIKADGPHATMILHDNTISRNGAGLAAVNSGQLISLGNNRNFNNLGPEGAPTGSFSPM